MKEIEILVQINDSYDKVLEVMNKYDYCGIKEVLDRYYYDPKRGGLKPDKNSQLNHCLRLRKRNDENYITYKDDIFEDNVWLYSDEYETKINSFEIMEQIFVKLGLKKLLEIHNIKRIYKHKDYEIVVEKVDNLGLFLEVEYCTLEDVNIKNIKEQIQNFIDSLDLNVSEELNMGKPEMMLRFNNIVVENE